MDIFKVKLKCINEILTFLLERSVMAASKLHQGGYQNLGWLVGGFNRAGDRDFSEVEGTEKLKFATIGGVSYYFLKLLLLLQGEVKEG